jgi:hydrogenase maturation factor
MHDATEGGVLGAIYELAQSSKRTLRVDRRRIIVSEESGLVCRLFGLDPLVTVSEGTLLVTCRPHRSRKLLEKFQGRGIQAAVIGDVGVQESGRLMIGSGGKDMRYVPPKFDPYWNAYTDGLEKRWK